MVWGAVKEILKQKFAHLILPRLYESDILDPKVVALLNYINKASEKIYKIYDNVVTLDKYRIKEKIYVAKLKDPSIPYAAVVIRSTEKNIERPEVILMFRSNLASLLKDLVPYVSHLEGEIDTIIDYYLDSLTENKVDKEISKVKEDVSSMASKLSEKLGISEKELYKVLYDAVREALYSKIRAEIDSRHPELRKYVNDVKNVEEKLTELLSVEEPQKIESELDKLFRKTNVIEI